MFIAVSDRAYQLIIELADSGDNGFGACERCRTLILDEECPVGAAPVELFLCPACSEEAQP